MAAEITEDDKFFPVQFPLIGNYIRVFSLQKSDRTFGNERPFMTQTDELLLKGKDDCLSLRTENRPVNASAEFL